MFGAVNFGLSNAQQGSGTDPEASVPVINGTVVISGTPEIGEVLSLTGYTIGGFPIPTETYQWYADDVEIVGATEATYEIQAGDAGSEITCTLTATNSEGSDGQTTAGVTVPATVSYAYEVLSDTTPGTTNYQSSFNIDNPVAGQEFFILCISEEAISGTPSIGGSTTGVSIVDTDTIGSDVISIIHKTGFDSTPLEVDIDFAASTSFLVLHGWQTVGLEFVPDSLVTGAQAEANTTSTVLAYTKAEDDVGFIGVRKYTGVSGTPSPSQDFGNSNVWAGHLAEGAAFSGNLTATTPTSAALKYAAVFTLTPSG